jgi:hypothetical protein
MNIFIESGKKKVFVGAVDWPGFCRYGRDEQKAVETLLSYGDRYAKLLTHTEILFDKPQDSSELVAVERHQGTVTTDFGAPAAELVADLAPIAPSEYLRTKQILRACWHAFDGSIKAAAGWELQKGPRGGGRDLEKIIDHVLEADRQYLRKLAGKFRRDPAISARDQLPGMRAAIFDALNAAENGKMPEKGPRGGALWSPRFFVRRVAWHVLDHAWEIEDRMVGGSHLE